MLLGHGTQLSYSSRNDFVKRNVFNCLLKEKSEVAVVTLVGRLFHARAAITRKHLSPIVSVGMKHILQLQHQHSSCAIPLTGIVLLSPDLLANGFVLWTYIVIVSIFIISTQQNTKEWSHKLYNKLRVRDLTNCRHRTTALYCRRWHKILSHII